MFVVGVDLGQVSDPTAIAVAGPIAQNAAIAPDIQIRHLERQPLGTPYPRVAAHLGRLVRALSGPAELVVDNTGIGRAVTDMLREQDLAVVAVTITGGKATRQDGAARWVPKAELVRALAVAVENGRLKIAQRLALAPVLMGELRAFERTIGAGGHTAFEGKGEHDDLVIAAALVAWWAGHMPARRLDAARRSVLGAL